MSTIAITISGVFYPKNKKDPPQAGVLVGEAWYTGLGVGGGPIKPSGPGDAHPDHTLPGDLPIPTHPIVIPPETPPPEIPEPPDMVKPPPPGGGWAWSPVFGWIYVPGSSTPGPRR